MPCGTGILSDVELTVWEELWTSCCILKLPNGQRAVVVLQKHIGHPVAVKIRGGLDMPRWSGILPQIILMDGRRSLQLPNCHCSVVVLPEQITEIRPRRIIVNQRLYMPRGSSELEIRPGAHSHALIHEPVSILSPICAQENFAERVAKLVGKEVRVNRRRNRVSVEINEMETRGAGVASKVSPKDNVGELSVGAIVSVRSAEDTIERIA